MMNRVTDLLAVIGFALEIIGLAIALKGSWRAGKELAPDGQFVEPLKLSLRKLLEWFRRVLLRRRPTVYGTMNATLPAPTVEAWGYTSPPPLPDPVSDLAVFGDAVQRRFDELVKRIHDSERRLTIEARAIQAESRTLHKEVTERIEVGEKRAVSRSVRSLREQVFGLLFIALGLVTQFFAILLA